MGFTVPSSAHRVEKSTAVDINEHIRREADARIAFYSDNPELIDLRLQELDEEWDIDRILEANAATLAFAGVALAASGSRKWLLLPAIVTGFLLQHALQGWSPPLPLLRRLGFRTPQEIEEERRRLLVVQSNAVRTGPSEVSI